jgi:peptidoglycan/LPS O-acetylase OafA/YrhL
MIKNIQYLRFVAALLVVFAHSHLQIFGVSSKITGLGGFGVDLFFVISGFIMPYILFGGLYKPGAATTSGAAGFIWRRVVRIWPMYFLATLLTVLLSYLVTVGAFKNPDAELMYSFNSSRFELKWLIESITFTHWNRPPLLSIGWTLQIEFFFYTAIAAGLLIGSKKLESVEFSILAFFFTAALLGSVSIFDNPIAKSLATPLIIEFLFGMFLYRIISSGLLIRKSIALSIIVCLPPLFLLIEMSDIIKVATPSLELQRSIEWGFPAFILAWAAISLESSTREYKLLSLLGDSSYSLYLVHTILAPLYVFFMVKFGFHLMLGPIGYLLLLLIICHAAGVGLHLYVEKPLNSTIRKYTKGRRTSVTA